MRKIHGDGLDTIYVYIAACKENYLVETVESVFANAELPQRVHVGVFNNILDDSDKILNDVIIKNEQVTYVELFTNYPMGTGFSRMNASLIAPSRHFTYMLQIEAHTIFDKNWDSEIIKRHKELELQHQKVVISCKPDFYIESESDASVFLFRGQKDVVIDHLNFDSNKYDACNWSTDYIDINDDNISGAGEGDTFAGGGEGLVVKPSIGYQESIYIYAGYLFARFNLIQEVMHDPYNGWSGDQFNYTMRLLSRGYKIFSTSKPVNLVKNKIKSDGSLSNPRDWRTFTHLHKNRDELHHWENNFQISLYKGDYYGYWGAPDAESLDKAKKHMQGKNDR